jgi:mevalonate kinase
LINSKPYHSKLLLFGEYTVIKGSRALAVPYPHFSGRWNRSDHPSHAEEWKLMIAFFESKPLLKKALNLTLLKDAVTEGLFFDSNIPVGYGVGSSGALCAAILDCFANERPNELNQSRHLLGEMEGFFHGKSSGLDPLVSFTGFPILVEGDQLNVINRKPPPGLGAEYCLFLLDTGRQRETAPLVEKFLKMCADPEFEARCAGHLAEQTNAAIDAFIRDDLSKLEAAFRKISSFQYDDFRPMIPNSQRTIWQKGLEGKDYLLKLCGAGGGGFLLGFTRNWENTREQLGSQQLLQIKL